MSDHLDTLLEFFKKLLYPKKKKPIAVRFRSLWIRLGLIGEGRWSHVSKELVRTIENVHGYSSEADLGTYNERSGRARTRFAVLFDNCAQNKPTRFVLMLECVKAKGKKLSSPYVGSEPAFTTEGHVEE
ncbi:hypothetical protein CEXT_337811 [Caerostris extrusa]|uniref:Uncharacterized protein n=1 Tax=Caerostris extrusa TaxID=172846 RepID=A0AAV4NXC0_CAEEX|nr:hypothetical protein CEXT_337811 [Caerostris extrusa]